MAGVLGGCGKKEIDVMDGIEVKFSGVDGYGTARITDEYVFEDAALEASGLMEKMDSDNDEEAMEAFQGVYKIEAVKYDISPSENLSNGDVVTVTVSVNNESVEDYKIQFTGSERKYANKDVYASYSIDKTDNLTMGDTVTVKAEYDEESLLQKGYMAEESTKEFVVDDCDRYVTRLAEIPEDMIGKMNKQFEDAFRVYVAKDWDNPENLNSIEYIGNYLLTSKEGTDNSAVNACFGVYKINAVNEEDSFDYYSYCRFNNIIILKDGTCSVDLADYKMPDGSAFTKNIYSGEVFWKGDFFTKDMKRWIPYLTTVLPKI